MIHQNFVGVFCRRDHPAGYGNHADQPWPDSPHYKPNREPIGAGAHGYVALFIYASEIHIIHRVANEIEYKYWQWPKRQDDWYSGTFDLVSIQEVVTCPKSDFYTPIGDNRAIAHIHAYTILGIVQDVI